MREPHSWLPFAIHVFMSTIRREPVFVCAPLSQRSVSQQQQQQQQQYSGACSVSGCQRCLSQLWDEALLQVFTHTQTQRCINTCVHIAVLTLSMLIFLWDTFPYTDASCFPCMLLYYAKVNSGCKAPFFNSRSNSHPEDLTVVIIGCGNVLFTNQMFLSLQHVCPFAFRTHFHTEFP